MQFILVQLDLSPGMYPGSPGDQQCTRFKSGKSARIQNQPTAVVIRLNSITKCIVIWIDVV